MNSSAHPWRLGLATILALIAVGFLSPAQGQQGTDNTAMIRGMITPETQDAIDAGLDYLAKHQNTDGSFGTRNHQGSVAVTSLSGLAFMAGGHQPGRGRYGKNVTKAVEYVLSREDRQQTPGFLNNSFNRGPFHHGPMYSHGFGTLFLAEVYGMVNNMRLKDDLRGTLDRAVKLIINSQNREGGWRYKPVAHDADISVTICQIMALRAARNAGLSVPKSVADKCVDYVKRCQDANSGGFRYQAQGFHQPGFARTAAGVVALYSAGLYDGAEVKNGLEFLKRYTPGGNRGFGWGGDHEYRMHYYYGHYYAAQAMWTAGGDYWQQWFPAIRDELLRINPNGHRQRDGRWDDGNICPEYSTAMALIILQIPNNYLPILQR